MGLALVAGIGLAGSGWGILAVRDVALIISDSIRSIFSEVLRAASFMASKLGRLLGRVALESGPLGSTLFELGWLTSPAEGSFPADGARGISRSGSFLLSGFLEKIEKLI